MSNDHRTATTTMRSTPVPTPDPKLSTEPVPAGELLSDGQPIMRFVDPDTVAFTPHLAITTCSICGRTSTCVDTEGNPRTAYRCAPALADRCVLRSLTRIANQKHARDGDARKLTAEIKRFRRQERNAALALSGGYR